VGTRNAAARLALGRAGQSLHQAATGMADAGAGRVHPVVGHLSAAADYLAAGRDLLHTHFFVDRAGGRTGASYWAPVITSGPVTAALLAELAGYAQKLAPWIARQSGARRAGWGKLTSAQLALRSTEPWLQLVGRAIQAAQRAHYPLPNRALLAAIPANAPPPRQPPIPGESVRELCERIPPAAERLRYAAFTLTDRVRWPAATSASWRRDALASPSTTPPSREPRTARQPWTTLPLPSARPVASLPPPARPTRPPGTTSIASKISSRPLSRTPLHRYPAGPSRHCANSASVTQRSSCALPSSTRQHTT
jgi:hypothetical protein